MNSKFYRRERLRQQQLLGRPLLGKDLGGGVFMGRRYDFVLSDGAKNLYAPIRPTAQRYFAENGISWWAGQKPTGHLLSSQIACLNHLMPLMNDPDAVLAVLNGVRNEFVDVLPIVCDKHPAYIAFEVVSDNDYLNEGKTHRGSNCTSIDALVCARHRSGRRYLIAIEWKYTEHYATHDKSIEDGKGHPKGSHAKGYERQRRYNKLIEHSSLLQSLPCYEGSVYYQEPFYQLMRQTLWVEQMIKHCENERLMTDDFLHIHVVPKGNDALLRRRYRGSNADMETSWRSCLTDPSRYFIVDPQELLSPVISRYHHLSQYLMARYW